MRTQYHKTTLQRIQEENYRKSQTASKIKRAKKKRNRETLAMLLFVPLLFIVMLAVYCFTWFVIPSHLW